MGILFKIEANVISFIKCFQSNIFAPIYFHGDKKSYEAIGFIQNYIYYLVL